jgi:hypothetical protein
VIRVYAEQPSPTPGGQVLLRVATDAPEFRVEFYRCGRDLTLISQSPWLPGQDAPLHLPWEEWGKPSVGLRGEPLAPWPAYQFSIPSDWSSGVYLALFVEGDGSGNDASQPDRVTPDGRTGRAIFVVRAAPENRARILYKLPIFTYHAYNLGGDKVYDPETLTGHWCLYNVPRPGEVPGEFLPAVNVHRPGGGTGATPYDIAKNPDPFDPTPRQTFVHWDARFIDWLEREGYDLDYCTDYDLHRCGRALLDPYTLLVSAGHDEYWTAEMRDAVEDFTASGGNVAFFSGNTSWWRVVFHDDLTFSRPDHWHEAGRPENAMIGVSFRNGGERDRDEWPIPVGYRVQHADHWVYDGTGLRDGDEFGGEGAYIVGYECDGAEFDRADLEAGRPVTPTGADGTPVDFIILGVGDIRTSGSWGLGNSAATMGLFTRGGTVFNAATTDWVRVLTDGHSPVVEQITRNVLDRLSR